jgi:hypothetical protein
MSPQNLMGGVMPTAQLLQSTSLPEPAQQPGQSDTPPRRRGQRGPLTAEELVRRAETRRRNEQERRSGFRSKQEAADILGVHPNTLTRLPVKFYRIGLRKLGYLDDDINAYLASRANAPAA